VECGEFVAGNFFRFYMAILVGAVGEAKATNEPPRAHLAIPIPVYWAFPIPKVHKETIMKEIRRLIELGVLEWQPLSEWAAPSFI
jgi:hypothetical protein